MKTVMWKYRSELMTDHWPYSWLHISKHFKGVSMWSLSFHIKGSRLWFTSYPWFYLRSPRHDPWKTTALTIRLGKWIITFGEINQKRYYKNCQIIAIIENGKRVWIAPKLFKH